MKRAELFIIIILAALFAGCDDMVHDALDFPGGIRYLVRDQPSRSMRLGGGNGDQINSITCDRSDNIIVAGMVNEQADLDGSRTFDFDAYPESIGSYNFAGNDIFISKFDPSGAYQWAKRLGGPVTDEAFHVASDSKNSIVVVGVIANEADLNGDGDQSDPWEIPAGIHGESDIFISKFDSTGTHLWSYRLGGTTAGDSALGVTVDHDDSIIITGRIIDNADLNGDGDTSDLGETPVAIHAMEDVFISKFDSSGNHLWDRRLGSAYHDRGCSIAHDAMNNVIVVGHVTDKADLNGDGDTSDLGEFGTLLATDADLFISKFDSAGGHLWSKRLGGEVIDNAYQVSVDGKDGIVVSGRVSGNADLDGVGGIAAGEYPEDTAGLCYGGWDIFITKFSADGTHLWARRLGGGGEDAAFGLAVDRGGKVFVTGKITGNADLNGNGRSDDGGAEDEGIYGNGDAFIAAFNRNGEPLWSRRLGSTDTDSCQGIAINRSGDLIFGGYVNGESDLNGNGDFLDDYEAITSGVHGNNDAFLTVFPQNYFLFLP